MRPWTGLRIVKPRNLFPEKLSRIREMGQIAYAREAPFYTVTLLLRSVSQRERKVLAEVTTGAVLSFADEIE